MSTKGSIQYVAIGTYANGTYCDWHLYHECLDDEFHLSVDLFSRRVFHVVLGPTARWLVNHGPITLWKHHRAMKWYRENERRIQWEMKQSGIEWRN